MSTWIIIKCFFFAVYGYTVFCFCQRLLGTKWAPEITAAAMILYEILFDYLLPDRLLGINYYLAVFISKSGLALIILFLFKGNISKKLAFFSVIYVIQELTAYAVVPLLTRSADLIADYVFSTTLPLFVNYWIFVVQYFINCMIIYKLSHSCSSLRENLPNKISMLLLVPSVFIILALEFAFYVCNEQQLFLLIPRLYEFPYSSLYQLVEPVILLLLSLFGLAANLIIVFGSNHAMRQVLTEQQLSMQVSHYKELEKQDQKLRHIRHDLKNHLICLQSLLSENDVGSARDYLYRIAEGLNFNDPIITTGNRTADAVINTKYQEARKSGIDFHCDMNMPVGSISDFDLCVILGNAIDNAMEACARITRPSPEKFIHIQTITAKYYLIVEIKNSMEQTSFAVKKKDSGEHGIGLKNIKEAVEKNSGLLDITIKPEVFCLTVMLPR